MEARRKSYQDLSGLKSAHKPPANFLVASKSKALKGFKIVQSLPFQSRVWLLLVAFVLFTITFWFTISFSSDRSAESSQHVRTNEAHVDAPRSTINTAVLYLQKPLRPFHGNHWYHIGEYYVSRHSVIQQLLHQQRTQGNNIQHLKLVPHDYRLSDVMSKMSFALIVLSFLQHSSDIQTIELFAAQSLQYHTTDTTTYTLKDITTNTTLTTIEHKQPLFGYYNLPQEGPKFINYASTKLESIDRNAMFSDTIEEFAPVHIASSALSWVQYFAFNPPALSVYCRNKPCKEAVYVGSVGAAPIPPVDWFAIGSTSGVDSSGGDANSFRASAWSMCGIQQEQESYINTNAAHTERVYNLVVYQRDLNRRFVHLNKVVETLRNQVHATHTATTSTTTGTGTTDSNSNPNTNTDTTDSTTDTNTNGNTHTTNVVWNIEILRHKEDADPCTIISKLSKADILLTAHGFQSTALMFMQPGSVIIEIFPYKYHRTTYLPLSRAFGLHYRSIQNTAPNMHTSSNIFTNLVSAIDANTPSTQLLRVVSQGACMRDLQCRSYARSRDISMPASHIELVLQTMREVETESLNPYAPLLS